MRLVHHPPVAALTAVLLLSTSGPIGGCGKSGQPESAAAATAGAAETTAAPAPATELKPSPAPTTPPAPPKPSGDRRDRRGIEIGGGAATKALFADAPEPPELVTPKDGATALADPAPHALPENAKRTSYVALLAHHLKTMRKLRGGIAADDLAVSVYDGGHLRGTFDRKALIAGDGRWLSAKITAVAPKPEHASVDAGLGIVRLPSLGWRMVYHYDGTRWRWRQLWRDRR